LVARLSEDENEDPAALANIVRRERPSAFLLEFFPFGRFESAFELVPALEQARNLAQRSTFIACCMRDLHQSGGVHSAVLEAQVCTLIERYFDAVLVHSDLRLFSLGETFSRVSDLRAAVIHTGYVVRRQDSPRWSSQRHEPFILVSAGGGRGGEELLLAAVQAQANHGLAEDFSMRILAGTFIPNEFWNQLRNVSKRVPRLELVRWVDDLPTELARSAVSVSRCGYNTALDLIRTGVPALVVPFATAHEDEQSRRASKLAGLGVVRWLPPAILDPKSLAREIRRTVGFRPAPLQIDCNGVERTVEIVSEQVLRR
jgi:predicted glycosyltransferase